MLNSGSWLWLIDTHGEYGFIMVNRIIIISSIATFFATDENDHGYENDRGYDGIPNCTAMGLTIVATHPLEHLQPRTMGIPNHI